MKTVVTSILSVQTKNAQSGKDLIVDKTIKGEKLAIPMAIISTSYGDFWLPSNIVKDEHNELAVTMHEIGDTFVAERDSKRTKGQVMGKDCPEGKEDEPLYFKGDTVTRTNVSYIAKNTQTKKEAVLSFKEKAMIMQELGLTISL